MVGDVGAAAERVARASYRRLLARLAPTGRDLTGAEDALADAFERALRTWPSAGVPKNPEGWLLVVARNRSRDVARSAAVRKTAPLPDDLEAEIVEATGTEETDKRLELLFACAHPALGPTARTPLMLQVVLGFDAARISAAFGLSEAAMAQRLVRAKRRIRVAGIAFSFPGPTERRARLPSVLEAIYGAYAIAWLDQGDGDTESVAAGARGLALAAARLFEDDPEAWGLASLLDFVEARAEARRGNPWPPLDRQDPARWDRALIDEGEALLRRAHSLGAPLGRFQLEAAIQSLHCDRARTGDLDRDTLVKLYRGLVTVAPTTGARRALAALEAS